MHPLPNRRVLRLPGYDYSQSGYYFVTICIHERQCFFGTVDNDAVCLSEAGTIAQTIWQSLPQRFQGIELDAYMIMPNHMHGILRLTGKQSASNGQQDGGPGGISRSLRLGHVVRTFKGATTYTIHKAGVSDFGWQHKYYESIVRNEASLERIRQYILTNPARWQQDSLYIQQRPS